MQKNKCVTNLYELVHTFSLNVSQSLDRNVAKGGFSVLRSLEGQNPSPSAARKGKTLLLGSMRRDKVGKRDIAIAS